MSDLDILDKILYEEGVELRACIFLQLPDRLVHFDGRLVVRTARHCIERLSNGNNPCLKRNCISLQFSWIS